MRQRVGAADHEGLEGQARIERRAAERIVRGRDRSRQRARNRRRRPCRPAISRVGSGRLDWLGLRRRRADDRGAHRQFDAPHGRLLGLPASQHALEVVRLDPALEEARRHRQPHHVVIDRFQVHAREPAREDVVADFGAEPLLNPRPALLIRARHFGGFFQVGGLRRHGRHNQTRARCRPPLTRVATSLDFARQPDLQGSVERRTRCTDASGTATEA